jgi:hypothetical protein
LQERSEFSLPADKLSASQDGISGNSFPAQFRIAAVLVVMNFVTFDEFSLNIT